MSKDTIYRCDECSELLSDEINDIAKPHLSLPIGGQAGWYVLQPSGMWRSKRLPQRIYHFCNEGCLSTFIAKYKPEGVP